MNKPYTFLPMNTEVRKAQVIGREQLHSDRLHGKIRLSIVALTPLLVASGELDLHNSQLINGLTMRDGIPVIPGSTLKGMSRSHSELLSYSCNLSTVKKEHRRHLPPSNKGRCTDDKNSATQVQACPACRLYGYIMGKKVGKGLVEFSECTLIGEPAGQLGTTTIPHLFSPLRSETVLPLYLNDQDYMQKKLYKHGTPQTHTGAPHLIVKAGAAFTGEITFLNLTEEELALVVLSLGAAKGGRRFQSKLGYGKPAFLGSVQIDVEELLPYERPFLSRGKRMNREQLLERIDSYGIDETGKRDAFLQSQIDRLVSHYQYEANKQNKWGFDHKNQKTY